MLNVAYFEEVLNEYLIQYYLSYYVLRIIPTEGKFFSHLYSIQPKTYNLF